MWGVFIRNWRKQSKSTSFFQWSEKVATWNSIIITIRTIQISLSYVSIFFLKLEVDNNRFAYSCAKVSKVTRSRSWGARPAGVVVYNRHGEPTGGFRIKYFESFMYLLINSKERFRPFFLTLYSMSVIIEPIKRGCSSSKIHFTFLDCLLFVLKIKLEGWNFLWELVLFQIICTAGFYDAPLAIRALRARKAVYGAWRKNHPSSCWKKLLVA